MAKISTGLALEARAHRLFLAQGSFTERGLYPAATPDRRMLATDIDVLVSEYGSGFHLTRRHVECKSGKFPVLDRILWLNGVRTLLRADSSYLIANEIDLRALKFARGLNVELYTLQHLHAWEKALGIPNDLWPCRSDYMTFSTARKVWNQLSARKTNTLWKLLRSALAFIEVESWLTFRYKQLNKLFRLIKEISVIYGNEKLDKNQLLCARYAFSALLVRFSQYVLAICADVSSIMPLDIERHMSDRLTFGDQDPTQTRTLTTATVTWISKALHVKNITMPSEIDPARLHSPPSYTAEMVNLVRRLLDHSHETRCLPLAVEHMQFGLEIDKNLPKFIMAAESAKTLAVLLKAFVVRTFKVPNTLALPVHADLIDTYMTDSSDPVSKSSLRRYTSSIRNLQGKDVAAKSQATQSNIMDMFDHNKK